MRCSSMLRRLAALAAFALVAGAAQACGTGKVDVGGYGLNASVAGSGEPVVVFEAGGGDDGSVWADIAPRVRAFGVTTVVYDRAGLGGSEPRPGPYSLDAEARAVQALLKRCGLTGPLVLVAHSYGGFVSERLATLDRRVRGLVLVDANIPAFFDAAELDHILSTYRPQYDALRAQAPALAGVMIPMMEAYPASARTVQAHPLPRGLPVIDIVAETSWATTPAEAAAMRKAHADFVAVDPAREAVFAAGSSHRVMRDKPDLVVDAVRRMVDRVRAAP